MVTNRFSRHHKWSLSFLQVLPKIIIFLHILSLNLCFYFYSITFLLGVMKRAACCQPRKRQPSTSTCTFQLVNLESAKPKTSKKLFGELWNLVKSTLRIPVGQSGRGWYHCSYLVFGYMVASRKVSISLLTERA